MGEDQVHVIGRAQTSLEVGRFSLVSFVEVARTFVLALVAVFLFAVVSFLACSSDILATNPGKVSDLSLVTQPFTKRRPRCPLTLCSRRHKVAGHDLKLDTQLHLKQPISCLFIAPALLSRSASQLSILQSPLCLITKLFMIRDIAVPLQGPVTLCSSTMRARERPA